MSLKLRPYPDYTGFVLAELPKIPAQWQVKRIKDLFDETDLRALGGNRPLLSLTRGRGLILHSEATSRLPSANDFSNYKVAQVDDLVMNRMQAWSGMFSVCHTCLLYTSDAADE